MARYEEFGEFEIRTALSYSLSSDIYFKGSKIGFLRVSGPQGYYLYLKGIRFQDGEVKFAPGASGRYFPSLDAVKKYLQSDGCYEAIKEAKKRRDAYNKHRRHKSRIPKGI